MSAVTLNVARTADAPERARLSPRRGLRREWIFGALLFLIDVALFSALYLEFLQLRVSGWSVETSGPGVNLAPLILCLLANGIIFVAANRYSLQATSDGVRFVAEHLLACLAAFALALTLQFSVFIFDFSRSRIALASAFVVFTPLTLILRRLLARGLRASTRGRTFLVLGTGKEAESFYRACLENGTTQKLRFAEGDGPRAGSATEMFSSLHAEGGTWGEMDSLLDESVEAVVLAGPISAFPPGQLETLVQIHFDHAPIMTIEAFHEKYWRQVPVGTMDPFWALRQDFRLARDSSYRFFKRATDLIVSALGLLLSSPLLVLCAVAIRLEGAGPILYCQPRVRRGRRLFTLYKFRTMRAGAQGEDLYTQDFDARVTKVGRWLRKLRVDELPQLWNVLRGDMSLIGPRAEWSRCVEIYEREIPGYHLRHLVKPGITGWAQVNYPYGRSVGDTVEKLKYDLYYIKNYSLLLDASIVLKTLYVILSFKGK